MAIYRLTQHSAFGPDEIALMHEAYEAALVKLDLKDRSDPMTEVVARSVILLTQSGEKNPARICELAVQALGESLQ